LTSFNSAAGRKQLASADNYAIIAGSAFKTAEKKDDSPKQKRSEMVRSADDGPKTDRVRWLNFLAIYPVQVGKQK
jgi:hypothetical protein